MERSSIAVLKEKGLCGSWKVKFKDEGSSWGLHHNRKQDDFAFKKAPKVVAQCR